MVALMDASRLISLSSNEKLWELVEKRFKNWVTLLVNSNCNS